MGEDRELKKRFLNFNRTSGFIDNAGIGGARIFRNRLRLREGPGAIDAEHIGGLTSGIHASLLTNTGGAGEAVVLQVFPAWPRDWDAEFRLLAPGAFKVTSSMRSGRIEFVGLESLAGAPLKLSNPWPGEKLAVYRNGTKAAEAQGQILSLTTVRGEDVILTPRGTALQDLRKTF